MNNQKTFIFIGPSGCGKGTQVELLAEYYKNSGVIDDEHKFLRLETGARFRAFSETDNYTAKLLGTAMNRGERLPDNFAVWTWTQNLIDNYTGSEQLFFDGCPRSLLEAQALDWALKFYQREKPIVVYLDVSREESKKRLLARGRADDADEDIERRLDWFYKDVAKAVEFYEKDPFYNFLRINGEQSREKIHEDIVEALER